MMGMDLHISMEGQILRANVTGVFVLHEANDCFAGVVQAIAQHKVKKVLVDCQNITGTLSTLDRYEHATFAVRELDRARSIGVSPATRFGYVVKPPVLDNERFGETVAKNRGANVHVADNMEEVLQWLEGS